MGVVDKILKKYSYKKGNLLSILLDIQKQSGRNFLPKDWLKEVSEKIRIPLSNIYGIVTFYSLLSLKPRGKYIIRICRSGPCNFVGGKELVLFLENELNIKLGETTKDGKFTLEKTSCLGHCDRPPVVMINDRIYTNVTFDKVKKILKSLRKK